MLPDWNVCSILGGNVCPSNKIRLNVAGSLLLRALEFWTPPVTTSTQSLNITALLDWSGCQTLPFESFANPPSKIIPDADEFLDGWAAADLLPDNMRIVWGKRRQLFLKMLEDCEIARSKTSAISQMMKSPRSHFAAVLDWEGILGIPRSLPKKEFDQFCPD